VAAHIGVTRPSLSRVLNGRAAISAEMAIRLGKAFGTDPSIWLKLQMQRDLWAASRKKLRVTRLSNRPAA
jgi:addiction module HigA family antidote